MSTPPESRERRYLRTISGEARGLGSAAARVSLAVIEPLYAATVALRNRLFDWGVARSHRINRPVISVGNLTTGGTGKTPVVEWLARSLVAANVRPAILTRGYRKRGATTSDEAEMLREALGGTIPILIDADRVAAAREALSSDRPIDVFIMDDGFQHRRLARDFDLVLIDATSPFGFGRVLPRGLLREKVGGLRRASAVLITRADLVSADQLAACVLRLRTLAPDAPIFQSSHGLRGLRIVQGDTATQAPIRDQPALALAGIANPLAFERMLRQAAVNVVCTRFMPDHHDYVAAEPRDIEAEAARHGAEMIVTTAKDWVKLRPLAAAMKTQIAVAELELRFHGDDSIRLFELVRSRIAERAATS